VTLFFGLSCFSYFAGFLVGGRPLKIKNGILIIYLKLLLRKKRLGILYIFRFTWGDLQPDCSTVDQPLTGPYQSTINP
jgi:hypothetical protein